MMDQCLQLSANVILRVKIRTIDTSLLFFYHLISVWTTSNELDQFFLGFCSSAPLANAFCQSVSHGQSVCLPIKRYVCDVIATLSLAISFISCSFLAIISSKLYAKVDHFLPNEGSVNALLLVCLNNQSPKNSDNFCTSG